MSKAAQDILSAFDSLSATDQHDVAVAILRRTTGAADMPDSALHELAAEVFRSYDSEEAAHANSPTR